jgi:hypothetical protein
MFQAQPIYITLNYLIKNLPKEKPTIQIITNKPKTT